MERKVGHLELRGHDPTREGSGTTFQARCPLQESWRKMEKRKKPVLVPRQHFGVGVVVLQDDRHCLFFINVIIHHKERMCTHRPVLLIWRNLLFASFTSIKAI